MKGGNKARGKQQTGLAPRMGSISHEGTSLCGAVGLGLGLKGLLLEQRGGLLRPVGHAWPLPWQRRHST